MPLAKTKTFASSGRLRVVLRRSARGSQTERDRGIHEQRRYGVILAVRQPG